MNIPNASDYGAMPGCWNSQDDNTPDEPTVGRTCGDCSSTFDALASSSVSRCIPCRKARYDRCIRRNAAAKRLEDLATEMTTLRMELADDGGIDEELGETLCAAATHAGRAGYLVRSLARRPA